MLTATTVATGALAAAAPAQALDLVGHRGARGLAPENTIPAFKTALDIGVTHIEVDVVLSRDGHPIARHDHRVDPALCSGGYARRFYKNLWLRQVRRLDCGTYRRDDAYAQTGSAVPGAHVPALAQVLRLGRPTPVRFVVELKYDPTRPRETAGRRRFARRVVRVLRRQRVVRRTTVQAFDWAILRQVGRIEPRLRLAALAAPQRTYPGSPWVGGVRMREDPFRSGLASAVERAGFDVLSPRARTVDATMLAAARRRGLEVVPWTVNRPERMRELIRMGVDGLITDYPDRLRAAAAETGAPVPPAGA